MSWLAYLSRSLQYIGSSSKLVRFLILFGLLYWLLDSRNYLLSSGAIVINWHLHSGICLMIPYPCLFIYFGFYWLKWILEASSLFEKATNCSWFGKHQKIGLNSENKSGFMQSYSVIMCFPKLLIFVCLKFVFSYLDFFQLYSTAAILNKYFLQYLFNNSDSTLLWAFKGQCVSHRMK